MTAIDPSNPDLRFRAAYEAIKPELVEVDADELATINVDIMAIVMMVLGCVPQLTQHRDRVAALPEFDITAYDKLETYALAAGHAHAQWAAASAPPQKIIEANAELTSLRDVLVSDVSALAKRKLLDGTRLNELRGPHGYKNLTFDVLTLSAMIRDNWATVGNRTGVTIAELDHAEQLAHYLLDAVGKRELGQTAPRPVAVARQRAYSLLFNTYNQARRAIAYLRWEEGDVEKIVPSIYTGRGGPRRKDDEEVVVAPAPAAPGAGSPPPAQPAPNGNATAPSAPAVSSGMPGESPIIGR